MSIPDLKNETLDRPYCTSNTVQVTTEIQYRKATYSAHGRPHPPSTPAKHS
jgi:hypothetical protein